MTPETLLVLDSSTGAGSLLQQLLPAYHVLCGEVNAQAIEVLHQWHPDLLFLTSPDVNLCAHLRQEGYALPIIVLGGDESAREATHALDAGADDYVSSPPSALELAARVRAHLRRAHMQGHRSPGEAVGTLSSLDGSISLDVERHQVAVDGHPIPLSRTEFALLRLLMENAEKVLTNRMLLQAVWGPEYGDADHYVRIYVRQLRSKVEAVPAEPRYIQTEHGVGYVFRCPITKHEALSAPSSL
jgi:two-component system KDP operon response regulator KdpE